MCYILDSNLSGRLHDIICLTVMACHFMAANLWDIDNIFIE